MPDHPTCGACRRTTTADGAYLCGTCTGTLGDKLDDVPELVDELATARSKQDRIGGNAGPRTSDEQPLGYRPAALEATDRLRLVLAWWTQRYAHELGRVGAPRADNPVGCAAWLASVLDEVRLRESAVDLLGQVRAVVGIAWRVVDRPAARAYAGPCEDCGNDLYGYAKAARLRCGVCGRSYLTADRRRWVLDALREHLATAAEIAAGIGELYGETINRKRINQWRSRGRLTEHGFTLDDRRDPLFRIGDVLDLAQRQAGQAPSGVKHFTRDASDV